jgi:hypothetical protein
MMDYNAIPPAVPITLRGILRENDQTFAVFTAGGSQRVIEAEFYDLLCFDVFRRHVCERFDLRTVYRGGRWLHDVVGAFHRGDVPITYDDVYNAVWVNSADLSFDDTRWIVDTSLVPLINTELERLEAVR